MHGVALPPTSTREEWLAQRRLGIGGSDAAAIAGFDRYRSPLAVWVEKTEGVELSEPNDAMEWGNRLEGLVAEKFAEETGYVIGESPNSWAHPEHPWMRGNPDRFVWEQSYGEYVGDEEYSYTTPPGALLEVKTTSHWREDEWEDGAPLHVQVQALHYLAVTGLPRAYFAVLIDGRRFRWFSMERDERAVDDLIALEWEWWHTHVVGGAPPAVDGSASTTDALRALYADVKPDAEILLPESARDVLHELRLTNALIADAKADKERLTQALQLWLGENEVGVLDGDPVVTWRRGKSLRLHNCPECPHEKDEPSRTFRLSKRAS